MASGRNAMKRVMIAAITLLCVCAPAAMAVVAFPGAEGHGAYSMGGRGGDVYHVTNLGDSGSGSLRYGITSAGGTASTGRTIVFDVSGTISLASTLTVNKSYITIAGQTAPGDGICIRDHRLGVAANHVIVRYIRCRLGDESLTEDDGIWIMSGHDIIMDHISSSWSVDEVFSCSTNAAGLTNVTVQWSMITEALNNSIHGKGAHGYGALIRGCYDEKYTYHHNLWAHNASRNPRPGNYDSTVSGGHPYYEDPCGLLFDFRNNVIYNWSGSRPGYDADLDSVCRYNYVGNYAKLGPQSSAGYLYAAGCKYFRGYYAGNYYNGSYATDDWTRVSWNGTWTAAQKTAYKMSVPFDAGTIETDTALNAYTRVLSHAGASLPHRDPVDTRVANEVATGTGQIIDTQGQVGGWPTLNSLPAPLDTDRDGMPDAWETARGLNPTNAADRNYHDLSADYTNLEVYLNSLIPDGTYGSPFASDFVIIAKRRVGRTVFDYDCKVVLTNNSQQDASVTGFELLDVPANMSLLDATVSDFGDIAAGGSATSNDTCTFRVDRSQAIDASQVGWRVTYQLVGSSQTLQLESLSALSLEPKLAGDISHDGVVDSVDLVLLSDQWLAQRPSGAGVVNFVDYAVMAGQWTGNAAE
jgi:pectate lyase